MQPFRGIFSHVTNIYTFNLDLDQFSYADRSKRFDLSLTHLCATNFEPPQRFDLMPYKMIVPPELELDLSRFPLPNREPSYSLKRLPYTMTSTILGNFAWQWQFLLRSAYGEVTLRRFAKAIINLVTCDYRVQDVSYSLKNPPAGWHVDLDSVPNWEPCEHQKFDIGHTTIVLHQDLEKALEIARDEAKAGLIAKGGRFAEARTYLLLSVRYVMAFHVESTGVFSYTAPERFMDGHRYPPDCSISLLLEALWSSQQTTQTRLHKLPLEIQDIILSHTSEGRIEAGRIGCALGLGTPFKWEEADGDRIIRSAYRPAWSSEISPIESKIYFGDEFSGLSYALRYV